MLLEEIRSKVEERVKERSPEIILGLYEYMIKKHNEFCGCNYCVILAQYVRAKKNERFVNRYWECKEDKDYFGIGWSAYADYSVVESRWSARNRVQELKKKKDELKKLI